MPDATEILPKGVTSRTVDGNGVIEYRDAQGKRHNPDGPAIINPDRATYWLVTGQDPNEMPDWWFNQQVWYRHGQIHRTDGPAAVNGDGKVAYWANGRKYTKQEFLNKFQGMLESLNPVGRQ